MKKVLTLWFVVLTLIGLFTYGYTEEKSYIVLAACSFLSLILMWDILDERTERKKCAGCGQVFIGAGKLCPYCIYHIQKGEK